MEKTARLIYLFMFMEKCIFFFSLQGITIRPLVEFLDVKRSNKKQPAVSEEIYNRVRCSFSVIDETLIQMKFQVSFSKTRIQYTVFQRSTCSFRFASCYKFNNCKAYI